MVNASGRVAVIGAGVSGLAAAWRAHRAGAEVTVFEASGRCGGVVRSERHGEWLIERGPHTLQLRPEVAELAAELGLKPLIAAGGRRLKRYVARGRRLVPLPGGPGTLIFGSFFSWPTKMRTLRQLLGKGLIPAKDLSFAEFVRRSFGEEALALAAQPFVSGIYAGDPEQLSTEYAFPRLWRALQSGSLMRGQAPSPLASFPGGLGDLPDALARALPPGSVVRNAPVRALTRADGKWTLHADAADEVEALGRRFHDNGAGGFDQVILTVPAPAAARMRVGTGEPLRFLADMPQPPVTVLNVGFPRTAVRHPLDGFGCLVPTVEKRSILGIIFTSSLFPDRAPPGHVAITVMLGGALQPSLATAGAEDAWRIARRDVSELLDLADQPPVLLEATRYPSAIPQYTLKHGRLLEEMAAVEKTCAGLILAGSYRRGISLPDCLTPDTF